MGKYSGNLVRTWAHAEESANFAPDPRHAIPRSHETGEPEPFPTTDQVPADLGSEYAGVEFPFDVAVGGGVVLATPSRSHDGRGGRAQIYSDDHHRETLATRHAEDGQRGYVRHSYTRPPVQDAHTVVWDEYRESPDIYSHANNQGATGPMRAIDGNPANNPEGIRRGMERLGPVTDMWRRLGRRAYRYQPQPLVERDYYIPINQPEVDPAPDILPFGLWKQEGTLTAVKRPALFRSPPTVDAAWLAKDRDQSYDNDTIGGGVAG